MSIFGKRRVNVTVHGSDSLSFGADGRYKKQALSNRKREKDLAKGLILDPHTTEELEAYIEKMYHVEKIPHTDDRYKKAYMGVKAHLVMEHASKKLKTPYMEKPKSPMISDSDEDYKAYLANENRRYQEAVLLPASEFEMHLTLYNIAVFQGETPVSWIEIYIESKYNYLAFNTTDLEYENHYKTNAIIADIVNYFGAGKEDKKKKNERYLQLVRVQ